MTQVKIVNKSKHETPKYATTGSAGFDLRANIDHQITLKPMERCLIPTGIHIQLPEGVEAQIRPRSGLSIKNGITVHNSPGTIDSDFIGNIQVILINISNQDFTINDGDRIAQMVVAKYERVEWIETQKLETTERGESGFGHTGVK